MSTMTDNEAAKQKKIFDLCERALSYEPHQRGAFIEAECGEDEDLKTAAMAFLENVDERTELPTLENHEWMYEEGDQIGNYRIVQRIGMGGMGGVYLAERDIGGVAQRVALKVMRDTVLSGDMAARFNEERSILARLNHPYIARLMDGGTTGHGLPFIVMELVEGVPIDQYCDTHRLKVDQRLQLVRQLALAIQSAHQNLVVHSDIKPSNVLVTEDGIPKLLDFGIAKLVRAKTASHGSDTTSLESLALTPDYASPEQINGEVITTASDIYSLGVLTYKLLVGQTPYQVSEISRAELATTVDNVDIKRASTLVATAKDSDAMGAIAERRQTSPASLARHLSGDIDTVLSKALAKEPSERYVSSSAFADDLMRCVKRLPISAKGDAFVYRLKKFVARHVVSVTAGSIALIALFGGIAVSLWHAHIAEKRFDDLHGFAETMIFDLHDQIAELPGATPARQKLTSEALHYLDRLAKDAAGDNDLQLHLSMAYKRMGDVLGNPTNANLGEVDAALESYRKALALAERLSEEVKDNARIERHRAIVYEKMADVLAWNKNMDRALIHAARSLELFKTLAKAAPQNAKAVMSVAISYVKQGDLSGHPSFPNAGKPKRALEQYRNALTTIKPLIELDERPRGAVRYYALIHERIGTMLSGEQKYDTALEYFEKSLAIREELASSISSHADNKRDVAIAFEKIGDVRLMSGQALASLEYYLKALGIYRELVDIDPTNTNAVRTLAIGLENLADAYLAAENRSAAMKHYDELIAIRRELVSRNPDNERLASELDGVVARVRGL